MAARSSAPKVRAAGDAAALRTVKRAPVMVASRDRDEDADRLVYERVRLGIMSALAVREELTFNELKAMFELSDGNLSAHARKLEAAEYLTCSKSFEDRRPRSSYRITPRGRAALNRYLDHVEAVIKATRRS
jgi:DNA-binding MarR family transcriptional regulator